MTDVKWSEWIEWHGGKCPLPDGAMHEVQYRDGETVKDDMPETSYWGNDGDSCDIIAYRYQLPKTLDDCTPRRMDRSQQGGAAWRNRARRRRVLQVG